MKIRSERMLVDPDTGERYPDEHGTRFFGVPAWVYCFALVMAGAAAMLAYTAAVR